METTYFQIDAKRIMVSREGGARRAAAGGAGDTYYAVIPRRKQAEPPRDGRILDFSAYCARMEADMEELRETAPPVWREEDPSGRVRRLPLLLDLLATGAILGMAITVVTLFLNL